MSDRMLRRALWVSVPLNLLGAALFGTAAAGHPSPLLPLDLPPFYAAQLAFVIGLFAGVCGWLALQPVIVRPLLAVTAVGKLGFFAIFVGYAMLGDLPLSGVTQATPDLVLGMIYAAWLLKARETRPPTTDSHRRVSRHRP